MRYPAYLEKKFNFPGFYRVKLALPSMALPDPAKDLKAQLAKALDQSAIKPGQTVAGLMKISYISSFFGV